MTFGEELERELEKGAGADVEALRGACFGLLVEEGEPVPARLRLKVWQALLGCSGKSGEQMEEWVEKRMRNEDGDELMEAAYETDWIATLNHDLKRTRTDCPLFIENETLHKQIQLTLIFFCMSRGVAYKQGLNELLAPFLALPLLGDDHNVRDDVNGHTVITNIGPLYLCFYAMQSKFLASIYDDEEFESLQCMLRLFQKLLQYHDPQLCDMLNQHDMLPELYAVPWFITLFARGLPLPLVYILWDYYIVYDDPFLHYLMSLAVIIECRDKVFNEDATSLPVALSELRERLKTASDLRRCIENAVLYRSRTPVSFRQELFQVTFGTENKRLAHEYAAHPCIVIPSSEVVTPTYNEVLENGILQYVLIDVRSRIEYQNGHLPRAIHIDVPDSQRDGDLATPIHELESIKGCHICLLGRKHDAVFIRRLIRRLVKAGFPYISWCKEGYSACHDLALQSSIGLVDHIDDACEVCSKNTVSIGSSIVSFFKEKVKTLAPLTTNQQQSKAVAHPLRRSIWSKGMVIDLDTLLETDDFRLFKCLAMNAPKGDQQRVLAVSSHLLLSLQPQKQASTLNDDVYKIQYSYSMGMLGNVTISNAEANEAEPKPEIIQLEWTDKYSDHVLMKRWSSFIQLISIHKRQASF